MAKFILYYFVFLLQVNSFYAYSLIDEEMAELFQRNSVKKKSPKKNDTEKKHSLLTEQIEKSPLLPQNPFMEFAKFDGQVK